MIAELFAVHVSVPELVLRGTLVYWLLFLIFRFILRRDVGAVRPISREMARSASSAAQARKLVG